MTRTRNSFRTAAAAAGAALAMAFAVILGVMSGSSPATADGTLGSLTFDTSTGSDLSRPFVQTHTTGGTGCPVGSTNIRAIINGPAPQWDNKNFVILSKTSNGISTTSDFSVQLGDNFLNTANANSVTIVPGQYVITLFCQNSLGTTIFGTFEGSIWFTSATAWQDTDPTPTTTPVTTPPTTTPPVTTAPATTPAPTAPGVVAAARTGGTARVGSMMTCSATFSGATASGYQWLREGVAISGANTAAYKAAAGDLGKGVACRATGIKSVGSTSSTSAARMVVVGPALRVLAKPAILGKAQVGKVLKATTGTWSPAGVTYHYVWLRNGKLIKHATKAKHTVVSADKGKKLTVRVTATRTGWAKGVMLTKARRVL
jgi:hypothetical protein